MNPRMHRDLPADFPTSLSRNNATTAGAMRFMNGVAQRHPDADRTKDEKTGTQLGCTSTGRRDMGCKIKYVGL